MPFDSNFAQALTNVMANAGWHTTLPDDPLPNPLNLEFSGRDTLRLIIYARRMTPQASAVSDHGRPEGEMHTQMLFDDSEEGVRNHLLFEEGAKTLLFGFYQTHAGYVIAAYDPERHRDYAYSSSLQVKEWAIQAALATGIVFYPRKSDEIAVVFHVDEIADYLDRAGEFHNLNPAEISEILEQEAPSPVIRQVFSRILDASQLPVLEPQERKRRVSEVSRFIRSQEFKRAIESVYERCAICGFQYDYVLDAAHIVPVSEGGEDTYANGLGLCPNCHRMFDKGLVLVDETGKIHIHPQRAEEYAAIGRAGSLEELQQTLRKTLWLPEDQRYHPSPENLRRVFDARQR